MITDEAIGAEVLDKIIQARKAIELYIEWQGSNKEESAEDLRQVQDIKTEVMSLITLAKSIGAPGQVCPACKGSGRL